jgi:hypothetical protein
MDSSYAEALLQILTWLIAALVLILGGILAHFLGMARRGRSAAGLLLRRTDVEELLCAGNAIEAKIAATAWCRSQPRNPAAYLILAKANFQLGELVESKRVLEELIVFSPESEFSARPYLDRIQQSLGKSRPRAVE